MRLIAGLIAVTASTSTLAGPVPSTATLAAPARVAAVATDTGMWRCDGAACAGPSTAVMREAVAVCTALADANGRVAGFVAAGTAFGDPELARCNRRVKS